MTLVSSSNCKANKQVIHERHMKSNKLFMLGTRVTSVNKSRKPLSIGWKICQAIMTIKMSFHFDFPAGTSKNSSIYAWVVSGAYIGMNDFMSAFSFVAECNWHFKSSKQETNSAIRVLDSWLDVF